MGIKTHGKSKTREYRIWTAMKQSCLNPNHTNYRCCGGKGIRVCNRWLKFQNFLDDMEEAPFFQSLGRIDKNGDFCNENCRWLTDEERALTREKRKGRPRKIENSVTFSFKMQERYKQHLERRARIESTRENRTIGVSELIRECLKQTFPMNETMNMFGGKK